jgi:hypothetical protein
MKGKIVLLLLLLSITSAHATTFQEIENDPLYKETKNLCVSGNPTLSLLKFQRTFIEDASSGVKEGVISALGIRSPLAIDARVAQQWESTPFGLGVLDCFGNDERGMTLYRAFMTELIIGYSVSHGVTWGLANYLGLRVFGILGGMAAGGLKAALSNVGWITELLEANAELLPRLRTALKWASRLGPIVFSVPAAYKNFHMEREKIEQNLKAEEQRSELDSSALSATPDERAFDVEHESELIPALEAKLKSCSTPESCRKTQVLLNLLNNDLATSGR